jgi:hypothetical protein
MSAITVWRAVAAGHPQLAGGPMNYGGNTVQLGVGFGGNISTVVFADAAAV